MNGPMFAVAIPTDMRRSEKVERNALENQVDLIPQRLNISISLGHPLVWR